jgi:hypothetical protein
MLATEEPTHPAPEGDSQLAELETHALNPRMRHIPTADWMVTKLDTDVRARLEKLWSPISDLHSSDPHHAPVEATVRALSRALDRVAEVARHHRGHPHPPSDLGTRLRWSLDQAITALRSADETGFGNRFPYHTGERSNSEPLWGSFLQMLWYLHKLADLVREFDPMIDERLLEGLVQLREPMRRDPIA